MSIHPRKEPAPPMRLVSCKSFGEAVNVLKDQEKAEHISTLLIRPQDSSTTNAGLLDVVDELHRRRNMMPDVLLLLKRSVLQLKGNGLYQEMDERQQASLSTSNQDKVSIVSLRRLELSNFHLDSEGIKRIARYLCGNATLSALSLKACQILPTVSSTMQDLAHSVNLSNLRVLDLSNNPIGTRSVVRLIDNLNTPCLTRLVLSMTMLRVNLLDDQKSNPLWLEGDQSWREENVDVVWNREVRRVGDSLANLVSDNKQGGYAPRLAMLLLNANDLGWKCVKKVVKAVLNGNRRLTVVELFATTSSSPSESDDGDDSDEEKEIRATTNNTLTRRSSIGDLYLRNKRNRRSNLENGNVTPPRNGQAQSSKATSEVAEPLTADNWRFKLGRYLWEDKIHRTAVKDASRYMLAAARVLSCKCREGKRKSTTGVFPITRLPPEIRQNIFEHLDEKATLTKRQIERIISFASDPTTLGYGSHSTQSGLSDVAMQHIHDEVNGVEVIQDDYGLLPHQPWSWAKMVQEYSMPRDWPATLLDSGLQRATSEDEDEFPDTQGGGGGPDGYGGITFDRIGPDSARRKWLDEQSGLQAFWDAI